MAVVAGKRSIPSSRAFKNSKQVGLWKRYYENGQLWDEGTYEDGKKVGEWKVYDKAGALKQSKVFKAKR
jgi:antitoxin component YwqK of YwqJK toxin-antitoxin module